VTGLPKRSGTAQLTLFAYQSNVPCGSNIGVHSSHIKEQLIARRAASAAPCYGVFT